MSLILFLLACGCWFCLPSRAAVLTADSPHDPDVNAKLALASDGDIIYIPAGVGLWTNKITFAKNVKLIGAGIGQTIIEDYVSTVPDQLMSITLPATGSKFIRISGITFRNGNRATTSVNYGFSLIATNTAGGGFRIDHCRFENLKRSGILVYGALGVMDNCEFSNTNSVFWVNTWHYTWNGGEYGDGRWAAARDANSTNRWFMENNKCRFVGIHYAITDASRGGDYVWRFNDGTNYWNEGHGDEGRHRATYGMQIYNNIYVSDLNGFGIVNARGGGGVCCSNVASGYSATIPVYLRCERANDLVTCWGGADGTNLWDTLVPGGPFDTGTHTGSNGATTLTDGSKSWGGTDWENAGYVLRNNTKSRFAHITANTGTTIDYQAATFSAKMTFDTGDSYAIWRVNQAKDQAGAGQGNSVSGTCPSPAADMSQGDNPWYSWTNVINGVLGTAMSPQQTYIRNGEHWMDDGVVFPGWVPATYPHPLATTNTISPASVTKAPSETQDFDMAGAAGTALFVLEEDSSGGASVNSSTGLYTAGTGIGTSRVRVWNLETGNYADATITVTGSGTTGGRPVISRRR